MLTATQNAVLSDKNSPSTTKIKAKPRAAFIANLGFDACIDHKADDFAEQLEKACDNGIDVYYENVGGKVFDAVLPLLNTFSKQFPH
jgi:NADPH-dependent curcumin reductase CurA